MGKEKKEIGMGKLIELLNEYAEQLKFISKRKIEYNKVVVGNAGPAMSELMLISKSYGFIKWLVENEKIDFSWEGKLSSELVNLFERKLDNAEGVIALLSIQDEPIEFLISILK